MYGKGHCGRVVRGLVTGAEVPWFKTHLVLGTFQKLSVFIQQQMGTWPSSGLGKVKGGEEEEWHPTSVTPLPRTS